MTHIQRVTASWAAWVDQADPDVLEQITNVQLKNQPAGGGYDVHISAWDADQDVVDRFATALGCPTDKGWEPKSGINARQWSLAADRDGLDWHLTATTPRAKDGDE